MLTGTDQLAVINRHIDTTRSALDTLHRHQEAATQQLVGLRGQMTDAYRQLARIRLDELAAGRMVAHLEEVDRATLELLKRREQAVQDLEPAIAQCASRLSALNTERQQAVAKRDALVKEIDERAAEIRTRLSGQEAYQAQERLAAETAAKAERAESKAAQAEADQAQKGQSYRADPLFMYLWERRYLTPDYPYRGLTRRLDGWVAGLIRYADARGNYYLLTELPLRLREHARRQEEIAEKALTGLRAMEAQALNTEEMVRDQAALAQVQQSLDEAERRIEEEEARHDELLEKRSQFSSGADDISRQAIDLQVSEIKDESVATLYLQAKMTPKPDDDFIVSRIRDLQQEEQRIQAELDRLQSQERQHQRAYQDLEALRRRYRRSGYDSNHSYFPSGFDLAALLALVLSGKSSGRDAWDRIDREQRFRRPRTPRDFGGGRFPGGFGGGFRTRGGFGGGFGGGRGGGGFRTGGRF